MYKARHSEVTKMLEGQPEPIRAELQPFADKVESVDSDWAYCDSFQAWPSYQSRVDTAFATFKAEFDRVTA